MRLLPVSAVNLILQARWVFIPLVHAKEHAVLAVPVSDVWYGIDGLWSAVSIRVGSPQQWINVLASTTSEVTLAVGPSACGNSTTCGDGRGGFLTTGESTSWKGLGPYDPGLLGFAGNADFGLDNIDFGDDVVMPGQTVGVFHQTDYWLGILGLGIAATTYATESGSSLLGSLVDSRTIPSHSYGYTAGAHYRLKGVPCSLTLGGYDANRFDYHNISFALNPSQKPVLSLNRITVSALPYSPSSSNGTGWPSAPQVLMDYPDAALFTIDSSTPFIWLPDSVCLQFENTLGLIYDEELNLYTFGGNNDQYSALLGLNLTFTFTLSDLPQSSTELNITLPYDAFDLELSSPFPGPNATASSSPTKYFPLRKAENASIFTIGRVFLQEAYLIVDYERKNFSIYQAQFNANILTETSLVTIEGASNDTSSNATSGGEQPLSRGATIGIAVSGSALMIIVVTGMWVSGHRCGADIISLLQARKRFRSRSGLHRLNSTLQKELDTDKEVVELSPKEITVELPAHASRIYEKD